MNFMKKHIQIVLILLVLTCCLAFYKYFNERAPDSVEKFTEEKEEKQEIKTQNNNLESTKSNNKLESTKSNNNLESTKSNNKLELLKMKIQNIKNEIEDIETTLNSTVDNLNDLKPLNNVITDEQKKKRNKSVDDDDRDDTEQEIVEDSDEDEAESDENANDTDKPNELGKTKQKIVETFTNFIDKPSKIPKKRNDTPQVQGVSCGLTANCYQY